MSSESALVVLIPEAESLVENFRKQYDPSAAIGIPAHVTILYPFISPDELTADLSKTLRTLFSKQPSFSARLLEVQRFPDILYLVPEPAERFRQLTEIIVEHFPDTPPYGGAFKEIIPHLTIAQVNDHQQMDQIAAAFSQAARGKLPIHTHVNTISWIDDSNGVWQVRTQFSLRANKYGGTDTLV